MGSPDEPRARKWDDTLQEIANSLSEIKDFRISQSWALEESKVVHTRIKSETLAIALEDKRIYPVDMECQPGVLNYFMDAIQRTIHLGYITSHKYESYIPLHFHFSAAVILDRELIPIRYTDQCKILIPTIDIISPNILDSNPNLFEETQNAGEVTWDIRGLRSKAYTKSLDLRKQMERDLASNFTPSSGLLCIDGPFPTGVKVINRNDIIGISKDHYKQYLTYADELSIFNMQEAHRSWMFAVEKSIPKALEKNEELKVTLPSFYLKLRGGESDPFFGLIRVEIPMGLKSKIKEISSAILAERAPVVTRYSRWDRTLYPIHMCEEILKARTPSLEEMRASLKLTRFRT